MSLKRSLDKLKQAIHAAAPPFPIVPLPGQLPDGTWNPDCCIRFMNIGSMSPYTLVYCNGKRVAYLEISKVPRNARVCPEDMPLEPAPSETSVN